MSARLRSFPANTGTGHEEGQPSIEDEEINKKMGDRSGGREAKGASLKKSKKNPGRFLLTHSLNPIHSLDLTYSTRSTAAKAKKATSKGLSGPLTSLPPPQPGIYAFSHSPCLRLLH